MEEEKKVTDELICTQTSVTMRLAKKKKQPEGGAYIYIQKL